MSQMNESLIQDVVAEVLGRLGGGPARTASAPVAPVPAAGKHECTCGGAGHSLAGNPGRGHLGVFRDANDACVAAHAGYLQLREKGVAARARVIEIVKAMAD